MANFGTRLGYPLPSGFPAAHPHPQRGTFALRRRPTRVRALRALRRLTAPFLRALDQAPLDLAWPPSPRHWVDDARRRAQAGGAQPRS
jgi:hypothetical protein